MRAYTALEDFIAVVQQVMRGDGRTDMMVCFGDVLRCVLWS
jgi:hypothetical protein